MGDYGAGCNRCNNTGYRGRVAIMELITVNDPIRDLISRDASTDELRDFVRSQGTAGLREAGLRAIYAGTSTIEEVVRETVLEEDL